MVQNSMGLIINLLCSLLNSFNTVALHNGPIIMRRHFNNTLHGLLGKIFTIDMIMMIGRWSSCELASIQALRKGQPLALEPFVFDELKMYNFRSFLFKYDFVGDYKEARNCAFGKLRAPKYEPF